RIKIRKTEIEQIDAKLTVPGNRISAQQVDTGMTYQLNSISVSVDRSGGKEKVSVFRYVNASEMVVSNSSAIRFERRASIDNDPVLVAVQGNASIESDAARPQGSQSILRAA